MKTQKITIYSLEDVKAIQKAADLLDRGSLVAFPTETVYGIGCKVEPSVIERLNNLKDRQPEKHYTLHVGSHEQIEMYMPSMRMQVRKLVQNGLPGPMTVIFDLDQRTMEQIGQEHCEQVPDLLCPDKTLGIRFPANEVACAILSRSKSVVVAPSANPAGHAPASTAQEVLDYFDGQIDCVIDAPNSGCDYNQSSTVVKVGKGGINILRKGAISAEQVKQWATIRILFVCTGNTCRSPMAEGFCKKHFCNILGCQVDELDNFGYIIASAGVAAFEGVPASHNAVWVCQEHGIDLASHCSRQLTLEDIQQSDLIFTMSQSHRASIVQLLPSASEKCFTLNKTSDISDPVGMDSEVYGSCFRQIQDSILNNMDKVL